MSVFYIPIIGVAAVLLALQLQETRSTYGIYLVLAACLIIILYSVARIQTIIDTLNELIHLVKIEDIYLQILIKIIGITYLSEFASDICRDTGYASVAGQIQIFGKLSILAISMPVISALLETLETFLS